MEYQISYIYQSDALNSVELVDGMHVFFRLENRDLSLPKTVTCHVLSTDTLKMLSNSLIQKDDIEQLHLNRRGVAENSNEEFSKGVFDCNCFPLKLLLIFTIIRSLGCIIFCAIIFHGTNW